MGTVLLTHWHVDHVGGVRDLLALCPGARVWKRRGGWLGAGAGEGGFAGGGGGGGEDAGEKVQVGVGEINDGDVFDADGEGMKVRALACEGHTVDHCAFVVEGGSDPDPHSKQEEEEEEDGEAGAMFTGDAVLGHGTAVFEDYAAYMAGLARMRDALLSAREGRPRRGFPGHGDVVPDARGRVEEYIAHRMERERQIVGALRGGGEEGMTGMQVVEVVYRDVPVELHLPALGGVLQVLRKLEGEGRVGRRGGGDEGVGEVRWFLVR